MKEIISQPWPWYIAGPLIGLMVPLLLLIGNKKFGISSSMRHLCAACIPAKLSFFKYDWRKYTWNLVFVVGVILGGTIGSSALKDPNPINLSQETKMDLAELGITDYSGYIPKQVMSIATYQNPSFWIFLVVGGLLVGFGTRYANGCTSGHSITGISMLHWTSLVATIFFFIGGLIASHFLLPILLK